MGAYVNFRVADPEQAEDAHEWLADQPENEELEQYEYGQQIGLWTDRDRAIELRKRKQKGHGAPNFHEIGEGQIKTSCITGGNNNAERIKSLWTDLFQKMHSHPDYDFEILSNSCGLDSHYFTPDQLAVITDDCDALTGSAVEEFQAIVNKAQ